MQVVCPNCHTPNRIPFDRISDGPKCGKCKGSVFKGKPVALNGQDFLKHINSSDLPVVVDFWADWCGPCKMMAPVFEQVAKKSEPKFQFVKLDTEKNQQLAARFRIQSIPTLAVFKKGREIARQSGAMPEQALTKWLDSLKV